MASAVTAVAVTTTIGYMVWDYTTPSPEPLSMGWSSVDLQQFRRDEKILQLTRELEIANSEFFHSKKEALAIISQLKSDLEVARFPEKQLK